MNRNNRVPIITATAVACVFAMTNVIMAMAQDDATDSLADILKASAADAALDAVQDGTQEFRLFESIENNASARTRNQTRAIRESRAAASSIPEFSLVGTTRIGDEHRVILSHKGGDTIVVKAGPNATTRITGYSDYSIVEVEPGKVSLNYPAGTPCVDSPDRGVKCTGKNNIAELTLAKGTPLAPRQRQSAEPEPLPVEATSGATPPDAAPANPFAALRAAATEDGNVRAATIAGRNRSSARFSPRRIPPEDVPPGMRVVSTPFGDRLVDQ